MTREDTRIKVLTAKIGTDDHYRGITAVTQSLRDAGMEVVFLGIGQRIDSVVATAAQEDAEVIGLSFLCGGPPADYPPVYESTSGTGPGQNPGGCRRHHSSTGHPEAQGDGCGRCFPAGGSAE